MKMPKLTVTSTNLGVLMIGCGTALTAYHAEKLVAEKFKGRSIRSHLSLALVGLVTFSIGCNLVANGIHDHIRARNAKELSK